MIHMIGNAHIDPVWLWRWQEGYQEIKATFQSALDRMNETDDVVFTCACAEYYRWVEENAPDMFKEVRRRVAEGRWRIVGGMWVQPDCNMPSGEAFARHLLYSQRFFKEKLGVTVKTGYNVDSFGHSAMLPALLSRAGIENYVFHRPGEHENANIPAPLFRWVSPDGSAVNAFRIPFGYGADYPWVSKKIENTLELEDKVGYPLMCFYGVGNHGGGPTIKTIAAIHEYQKNGERGAEVRFSDPDTYFDEIKQLGLTLPEWKGELQHHASGCYSATSLIKRLNRRTENALIRCEFFGAMAECLTGHQMKSLEQGWHNLMFNQFHDMLCGCSYREAYDASQMQLGEAMSIAAREENAALQKISWRVDTVGDQPGRVRSKDCDGCSWELDGLGMPVVVFNPHAFEVIAPITLQRRYSHVTDEDDNEIPAQVVRASRTNGGDKWDTLFMAKVPALGYRLYWIYMDKKNAALRPVEEVGKFDAGSGLKITETSVENARIAARFDKDTGALVSLIEKDSGREVIAAPALPRLVDIEKADTWAHGIFTFDKLRESFQNARFEILETGPVRVRLRITVSALRSTLIQEYMLYAGSDQLVVNARLDMQEDFRMLKLCFPIASEAPKAHAEISYGVIERPMDGCEETGHRWMDVSGEDGGLAVLNDSKYSFSAVNNELRLTVANTSIFADHYGQEYRDDYCIHADIGWQEFKYVLVPHDGIWQKAGLAHRGELLNRPLEYVVETYHKGDLPVRYEGLTVDADNITVGALKRSEDGDGYVLRLNETIGRATKAVVDAKLLNRRMELDFKPLEIKTLLLPDDASLPVREVLITEW